LGLGETQLPQHSFARLVRLVKLVRLHTLAGWTSENAIPHRQAIVFRSDNSTRPCMTISFLDVINFCKVA
jgi:hypothetical protein